MFFRSKPGKPEAEAAATAASAPTPLPPASPQSVAPQSDDVPSATPSPTTPERDDKSPDAEARKRQGAAISTRLAAAFGNVVTVFMRSPQHRQMTLQAIEEAVVPAVLTRQFYLTQAQSNQSGITAPIGVVLWASVSPEVDQRLSANPEQNARLATKEWRSGEILWLMEAIGEPKVVSAMLQQLQKSAWGGRPVKMRAMDPSGKIVIRTLTASAPAKGSTS